MTVEELKNSPLYSYEINICEEYKDLETDDNELEIDDNEWGIDEWDTDDNEHCIDEWGCAFAWYGEDFGVEYNFCIDNGCNCSAIYKTEIDDDGYLATDYSTYSHYEVNFDDENWKRDLENALCTELIKFHNL